jgi:regulatory protein
MARPPKAPRTLKGRALALLAQREQSRVELRRKLLRHALAEEALAEGSLAEGAQGEDDLAEDALGPAQAGHDESPQHDEQDGRESRLPAAARVEALLDWLEAHRYLSEQRFTESRVHARAPRFGNLRIRMELAQHRLELSPEAEQALIESEFERARAVRERKFGALPANAAERARQARFLGARGFSAEVVRRVLRAGGDED